jgi:hypothetical protein
MNLYVKISGGLGNNLFRIATGQAYCLKNNGKLFCDISENSSCHGPFERYYKNFFKNLVFSNIPNNLSVFKQPDFGFHEITKMKTDFSIEGYFQSEKFFKDFRENILNLFEIDFDSEEFINNKYSNILNEDTCSLHIRRGDYKNVQHILPILPIDYYKKSIYEMGDTKYYLIFSDDINWCKENLNFIKNKIFIENQGDVLDLYLMSKCKNNIIANSSYSWWGAWLNKNNNKKVVSPNLWFGPMGPKEIGDIIPDEWVKI